MRKRCWLAELCILAMIVSSNLAGQTPAAQQDAPGECANAASIRRVRRAIARLCPMRVNRPTCDLMPSLQRPMTPTTRVPTSTSARRETFPSRKT